MTKLWFGLILLIINGFAVKGALAATYAVTGGGGPNGKSLFELDPTTGGVTLVRDVGIPMTGLVITSEGRMFASSPSSQDGTCYLAELSMAGDIISNVLLEDELGVAVEDDLCTDLSLDLASDTMYLSGFDSFGEIDMSSGSPEYRGSGPANCGGAAVDGSGRVFCSSWCDGVAENGPEIFEIDPLNGPLPGNASSDYLMGMGLADNGQMLGSVYEGQCSGSGGDLNIGDIVTVDVDTGGITLLRSLGPDYKIHDIAAIPGSGPTETPLAVSTVPSFFLLALSGLLALFGVYRVRASK